MDSIDNKFNIYFNEINILCGISLGNIQNFKYEAIFPYSFDECVCALSPLEMVLDYDTFMSDYTIHKENHNTKDENSIETLITTYDVKLPFPLKTLRKYPISIGCNYKYDNNSEELIIIWKPSVHESIDSSNFEWAEKARFYEEGGSKPIEVYFMFDFVCFYFKKLNNKKTQFFKIHIGNYGGWGVSKQMTKLGVKLRGEELKDMYFNQVEKFIGSKISKENEKFSKDKLGILILKTIENEKKKPKTKKNKHDSIFI